MMWIWIGLVIALTLLELAHKNYITIWFVCSAIVSLILSIFVDIYLIQFLVFVILGSILLLTQRNKLIKFVDNKKRGKNEK